MNRLCRVLVVVAVALAYEAPGLTRFANARSVVPSQNGVAAPTAPLAILAGPRVDPRAIERFYNDAIVKSGNIDAVALQLANAAKDASKSKRYRANALFVRSSVQWRHGAIVPALASADEGLAIDAYDDFVYYKARLLDAIGRADQAREWLQKALALTTNPQIKESIGLRLTFLDAIDSNVKGLVELARTRPKDFRNRAAVALGILDFNSEALELYQGAAEGADAFRDHLRVAQWAIKGGNAAKAQDQAWQAVQAATLDKDRRYALSLCAEAHALDGSLSKLLARLGEKRDLTRDEQSLRIELLGQTGQYQKAVDLFKNAHGGELTPELQQELLRIYRDAGQDAAMVAEYRALMTREPSMAAWPEGLSQYYLERGDQPNARKTWEEFLGRNTDVDALLQGSQAMTNFGLHDLALTAIDKALANARDPETAARVRLDQFELYRRRGRNAEAEAALVALDKLVPPDSIYRTELADAFERIQKPELAAKTLEGLAAAKGGLSLDEKMRLAWLLDSIGRRDDALRVWRDLWNTETLAARRKLVAERLLLLAAELGTLGDLAVEIEEKLAGGTAEPRDVSLLVNIYTKVGDSVSAVETIATAAAQGGKNAKTEVENLKEQAQVYLSMAEYQDFARITRRLLEIDPPNRVDYLQQLLLNQIEKSSDTSRRQKDETAELQVYLDKLKEVGGDAVGTEFEAGVLELAGFRDLAIDGYRRALAREPDRADDQLLLADLLRQAGRGAEAVASLQYLAEGAASDELFLIAIDGITNMRTGGAAILKWAERRALERLTSGDDKIYLYEMLSDLAEEARDAKVYVAALENSLPHADSRRSYVLRELLAVTAEVTSSLDISQRTIRPDPKANVVYARRLISLGEELPPEVFIDLGRTFIKMNDPAGAKRAFRLAFDTTGDASVVLDAGKLFERGGFDRESIAEYERALIASSGSVETMSRLARVRNRSGATATANDLYSRALLDVVSRQNRAVPRGQERTPPALESLVTFEYRKYFSTLLAGFLSTLPPSPAERATKLRAFEDAVQDELRQVAGAVSPAGPVPLAYYPRLTVLSQTIRTLSYGAGVPASADRADAALLQHFGKDPLVVAQAVDERARWGFAPAPGAAAAPRASDRALVLDTTDYVRAVGLALGRGDQDAALLTYRQWVRYAGQPKPPIRIGTVMVADRSPGIQEVIAHAWRRLDERRFGSLAEHILGLVTDQDAYAEQLLVDVVTSYEPLDVPILARVETTLGQPLMTEDRLLGFVNKLRTWQMLNMPYVLTHVSTARQIDLLDRYLKNETALNWSKFFSSLGVVLAKPLGAEDAGRLLSMLKPGVQAAFKRTNALSVLSNITSYPFTTGMAPANAPIVDDFEQFLGETFPQVFKVGYIKAAMLRDVGRDREAVAAFVDSALKMFVPYPAANDAGVIVISSASGPTYFTYQSYVRSFAPFLFPKNKPELLRVLDEKEAALGLTDALISLRVDLNNSDPASDMQQFLGTMETVVARNPRNELLLNTLFPLFDQAGNTAKAIDLLTRLTALRPENRTYRYRLVLLWQKVDYPEKAAEAAGGSTLEDLNPVPVRPGSAVMIESLIGPPAVRFPSLKRAVDAIKAAKGGGSAEQAALGLRTLLQTLPPGNMSLSEFSQTRDTADPYLYFRDLFTLEDTPAPRPAGATPPPAGATAAAGAAAAPPAGAPPPPPPPPAAIISAGGGAVAATPLVRVVSGSMPPANSTAVTPGVTGIYERLVTTLENTANPADSIVRPPKLMDVVVKYPYAVAELESYIGTLRADDLDKQYVLYNWLIEAHANNGRIDDELARRGPAVLGGTAGRKDVAIWLGLAARQPEAKALELARRADESGLAAGALTGYQRWLLARLYVTAGQRDKAVEAYIAVATAVLAGAANTLQPNTLAVDQFGRDNGLMLFTGLGLYDDARSRLNADGMGRFVNAMLALSKPSGSPSLEQSYARFVLILNARVRQAGLTIPALQQAAASLQAVPGWIRAEILQAVSARAQLGQVDDALLMLQATLKKDMDTRDILISSISTLASRQYQIALGLTGDVSLLGPLGPSPIGIEEFKALFPGTAGTWPGAREWVERVTRELPAWVANRSINRDAGVQLLSLMIIRLNQVGDTSAARAATKDLSDMLRGGQVSVRAGSLAVTVAEKVGAPLDLAVLQEMVRNNRLHVSRVVTVLTRTVEAEGADRALQLGDVAARFTSADELLRQLVAIARTAGHAAELQRWTERQRQAAAARAALARRSAIGR